MSVQDKYDHIYSDNKLGQLILYIAARCGNDEKFGATKLNKLLFFSDFAAYVRYGKSITGQEYQALNQGPAPRHLVPVRNKLVEDGQLIEISRVYKGKEQKRVIPLVDASLDLFTAEEISIIDEVIGDCWNKSASEVSLESHRHIGWKLARPKETIPYEVALVENREPTPEEISRGLELETLAEELLSSYAA